MNLFKDNYRNNKRKAAIWILRKTCVAPKMIVKRIGEQEINTKTFPWIRSEDLLTDPSNKYNRELLRDAIDLLSSKKRIDLLDNDRNRYDVSLRATLEGEVAKNEELYEEEIRTFNSDRIYRTGRWAIPAAAIIISAISLYVSLGKDNRCNAEIERLQQRIEAIEQKIK